MSDFDNIPPPPRKAHTGSKPTKSLIAKNNAKAKAKYLETAARKTRERLDKLRKVKAVIDEKTTIIDRETIDKAPPTLQKYIDNRPIIFEPNPGPQTEFLASTEQEVFFGGARGGGKSMALLVDPLRYCHKQAHRGLLIRRTMPELRDLINNSQHLYPKAFPGAKWREQEKEWRFPSGARIEFGYAETRNDALRYQGQAYTWIGIDELPQYPTVDIWNDLRGSLRSTDPSIPTYMRASGNPGNIGSPWVKEMFIDPAEPNTPFKIMVETPAGPKFIERRYIPSKLSDNPYLTRTDAYLVMLASLPEMQRRQWLEGDWDAFDDAAFPEFRRSIHVVEPFEIPKSWVRFRACDWGYSSPACVLWFAVDFEGVLWVYREFYTQGKVADEFANMILAMEQSENIRYGILDASVWQRRGDPGPSIAERMIQSGCRWRPSDRTQNSRVAGKMELHRRLKINELTEKPSLRIFSNCKNLIRTLPQLPLDKNNMEDVDTKAEDHAYDALRYGIMSRPISPSAYSDMYGSTLSALRKHKNMDRTFGY